ncbi:MAG: alpha/beta hydrolase [bacterium]|nr:alpha/beta hydrolase [bacterium]
MSKAVTRASWFAYFPNDYRWSAAFVMLSSITNWGGASFGELDQAGRQLAKKVGDDNHWFHEWTKIGDRMRDLARSAERKKNNFTAAGLYKRACMYYQAGERMRTPKDKKANDVYRRSLACFRKFAQLTDGPKIEHVEIPFEKGKKLPALFVHAENTKKKRPPAVVFFDGFDITKEIQYCMGVEDLVRRGISVLIVDAPGNGESIRFRNLYLRHDHEVAGAAALDYLEKRKDVNGNRVGVMAISLGGYYAPRNASMEKRFKACLAWGAIWDYEDTWKKRIAAGYKTALSVPGHHLTWIFNVKTTEEALVKLKGFKLQGVVQKMKCPFLLVHGEDDQQQNLSIAKKLYNAVGSKDKTLRVFTGKEGGAQHCHMDNLALAVPYMHDWLKEKLKA